jgi:hypothetical protein
VRQNHTQRGGTQVNFVEARLIGSEIEGSAQEREISNVLIYHGFPGLLRKRRCRGLPGSCVQGHCLVIGFVSRSVFHSRQIAIRNQKCAQAMGGPRL